ncbi:MAG: glycosyltransferase [Phycisphaerae bacterium]|nr:glycosyltransferase [Phycisphaerae bacterium]
MPEPPLISILLPTRQRPQRARRLLESIAHTAGQPQRMEILLCIDDDDTPSHAIDHPGLNVQRLIGPAGRMGELTRACYRASRGRYVLLLNDDVICRTDDWDGALVGAFEQFGDDVAMIWANDGYRGRRMPNFPALSRTVCELMDGPCPADYHRMYIDTHLFDTFCRLKALGHDRMVYLPGVLLEHLTHEMGKASHDSIYDKPLRFVDELAFVAWDAQRQVLAERLARYIEGRRA